MVTMVSFLLNLFLCILSIGKSTGKIQEGTINSHRNVAFFDTFAYGTDNVNLLQFKIFFPLTLPGYELAMFDDSVDQWPFVRQNEKSLTCHEKLSRITDPSFKFNLTEDADQCKATWKSKEKWLLCKGYKDFSSNKTPQRYFFHLANCHGEKAGIWNVSYQLHMTNGLDHLEQEFSYDQRYLMVTDLGFLFSYLGIFLVATINHVTLYRKHLLHVTYRLFYLSLILQLTSLLLHCTALGQFSIDGIGLPWLSNTADILYGSSSVVFVALLLLVSKGYTITRARMSLHGSIKLAILTVLYATSYLVFFIYRNVLVDPRDVLALNSIKVAAGPLVCRITGLIWTLYGVFFTVKGNPDKLAFYLPFSCFFSIWFMTEPVSLLLATSSVLHQMDSALISNGLQLLTAILGHTYFLFLTMPVTLNKSFPFHLPVSKVGILPAPDVGYIYRPSEDHHDVFSNGSPNSARGTVKSVNAPSSDPTCINLPRVFLHDDSFDEQRRQTVVTRVASTLTPKLHVAMPSPPVACINERQIQVNEPSGGFPVFCVMDVSLKPDKVSQSPSESPCQTPTKAATEQKEYVSQSPSKSPCQTPTKSESEPKKYVPYKLTPIIAYNGDEVDDVDIDEDDNVSVVSLGVDVFNKPLPGDELKRLQKVVSTKLPKLKIPGKKKPACSTVKSPRPKDAKDISSGDSPMLAWSSSTKKERKRLKRLTRLGTLSQIRLPGIKTTPVTKFDPEA